MNVRKTVSQFEKLPISFFVFQAEKRAHHNALERKRRDHIKESFSSLRDSVPTLKGEKVMVRLQDCQFFRASLILPALVAFS